MTPNNEMESEIRNSIGESIDCELIELENESHLHAGPATESHFKLTLVSGDFEGKSRVKRHQTVYRVLSETMKKIHALALHVYTPEEWKKAGFGAPDSPKCSSQA